ncbi:hypothetical protein RIR_jg17199.t1 [Rhizophagus irregularis DAOM 181602=DAOM 197198]|nr:hypothetical protein RIR_jg17199.t1 [Rhizophagus irregularis DAOM 181602=DAOM 197198]
MLILHIADISFQYCQYIKSSFSRIRKQCADLKKWNSDENLLQKENLSEEDSKGSNYKEFELYKLSLKKDLSNE